MSLAERVRYLGRKVECPICSKRFRSFAPELWDGTRWHGAAVRCPACGSRPRHRLLALVLDEDGLIDPTTDVLHFAPEPVLADRLRAGVRRYVSADLEPGAADVVADITALPFDHQSFDVIVCSHVLEHVPDDGAAMRELHRVLRSPGVAFVQTPVNYEQAQTFEDPAAGDPADRLARFSQADHVRVYGVDLQDRLNAAGFSVTVRDAADFGDVVDRYVLEPRRGPLRNDIYRCERVE
jgi:SAM-dependent methyltransferase